MAKRAKIYDGTQWQDIATAVPDLTSYQVKAETGLQLVKTQTIGTGVSSVTVTDAFSATYDNYKIVVNGGVASTGAYITLQLGATTSGYYASRIGATYGTGAQFSTTDSNGAKFTKPGDASTNGINLNLEVTTPFASKYTFVGGTFADSNTTGGAGVYSGVLTNTLSYTDFTIAPNPGTITGGTIYVYGYAK